MALQPLFIRGWKQLSAYELMARQSRQPSRTGIYHVMMRGINHQNIFEEHVILALC